MREGESSLFYGQRVNGSFVLTPHFEIFVVDTKGWIFQEEKSNDSEAKERRLNRYQFKISVETSAVKGSKTSYGNTEYSPNINCPRGPSANLPHLFQLQGQGCRLQGRVARAGKERMASGHLGAGIRCNHSLSS